MDQSTSQSRKAITLFLVITFSLSSLFYLLIIQTGKMGRFYSIGLMWCPTLATIITSKLLNRKLSDLAWQWGNPNYQL